MNRTLALCAPRPRTVALTAVAGSLALLALAPLPVSARQGQASVVEAAASTPAAVSGRGAVVRPVDAVTALLVERLLVADVVAAAKYGTVLPIEDPVRERQVLEDVTRRAAAMGLDPVHAAAVFRDQMEAGKKVQRALFARWDAHPEERPSGRPDLTREVRPVLDRITTRLLDALKASQRERAAASCPFSVSVSAAGQAYARELDRLHTVSLLRGLRSVCTG